MRASSLTILFVSLCIYYTYGKPIKNKEKEEVTEEDPKKQDEAMYLRYLGQVCTSFKTGLTTAFLKMADVFTTFTIYIYQIIRKVLLWFDCRIQGHRYFIPFFLVILYRLSIRALEPNSLSKLI